MIETRSVSEATASRFLAYASGYDGLGDLARGQYTSPEAAGLRHVSVSDYVRAVTVPQAKREIQASRERVVVVLTADEQLAFWNALNETPVLTPAQRRLGAIDAG